MYNESQALASLERKKIFARNKYVDIETAYKNEQIGNKTWGMLDFLVEQGYRVSGFHQGKDYVFMRAQGIKADPNSKRQRNKRKAL